eukprot:COSAG05_NODE_2470_length_3023_cov_2.592339_2_plen_88_part_00
MGVNACLQLKSWLRHESALWMLPVLRIEDYLSKCATAMHSIRSLQSRIFTFVLPGPGEHGKVRETETATFIELKTRITYTTRSSCFS